MFSRNKLGIPKVAMGCSGLLVLAGLGIFFFGAVPKFQVANRLVHSPTVPVDSLTGMGGRLGYVYTYRVNSRSYSGLSGTEPDESGSTPSVHYLAEDPCTSSLNPTSDRTIAIGDGILATGIPLLLATMLSFFSSGLGPAAKFLRLTNRNHPRN